MAVIGLEDLEKSPDSNVRFCLRIAWDAGRSQSERSDPGPKASFEGDVMRVH
jgi:hypothetical protein